MFQPVQTQQIGPLSRWLGEVEKPNPSQHSIAMMLEWHHPRYRHDIARILWMEHMMMSICDIKLTSGSWDLTNQTLMLSWYFWDSGRYPAERNPPGSYTTPVSAKIIPRLCANWKSKASEFFFICYLLRTSSSNDILSMSLRRPYMVL